MKRCKACHEEIQDGARLCVHCKNYQDFRRHFSFGNVFLSLVIALISVVSIAGPTILRLFQSPSSDLDALILTASGQEVAILISNAGEIDGFVIDADFDTGTRAYTLPLSGTDTKAAGPRKVSAGQAIQVFVSVAHPAAEFKAGNRPDDAECTLRVNVIDMPKTKTYVPFQMPCSEFFE